MRDRISCEGNKLGRGYSYATYLPMMIPKAHIPVAGEKIVQVICNHVRTTKCKGELEKGDSSAPARAKATVHYPNV